MNVEVAERRKILLAKIDKELRQCEGCETHAKLNTSKDITMLTNACKACPIGIEIACYGALLLTSSVEKRKAVN